jgi:hypothetical protein
MQPIRFLQSLIQDLRYAVRGFTRNPMFTLTAVSAAALGNAAPKKNLTEATI